jgi:hypothetical protein
MPPQHNNIVLLAAMFAGQSVSSLVSVPSSDLGAGLIGKDLTDEEILYMAGDGQGV